MSERPSAILRSANFLRRIPGCAPRRQCAAASSARSQAVALPHCPVKPGPAASRGVTTLRSRFLAQPHERRAHQHLQLRIALRRQLIAHTANRFNQRAAIAAAVEFREFAETDRGGASRVVRFQSDTGRILHQYFITVFSSPRRQHFFQKGAHFPRRHAPGLVRYHYFFLFSSGTCSRFLVEQFRV